MKFLKHLAVLTLSLLFCFSAFADKLKVGFVYVGPVGDHGWTYMHEQGRLAVKKAFGDKVETTFIESVKYGPEAETVIRAMAKSGTDIIFATSFGYMEPMLKVAKEFPNVKFEHATGYKTNDNMSVYSSKFYQGRYIQGVIAGHMSKNGKAGYIASFPIPEVVRGINAFYLAASKVNPDIQIKIIWLYTWYDPGKEADAAQILIDQGADIIVQHTDTYAPCQVAQKNGVKAFGQASNQYDFCPEAHLTAIIDEWGPYYVARAKALADGTWESTDTWKGLASGMVEMAPYRNMHPDTKFEAIKMQKELTEGKMHSFEGPIYNQAGELMVPEGEVAPDGMLLGMNWYVQGIEGTVPQ